MRKHPKRPPKMTWSDYVGQMATACAQHAIVHVVIARLMFLPNSSNALAISTVRYKNSLGIITADMMSLKLVKKNATNRGTLRLFFERKPDVLATPHILLFILCTNLTDPVPS